MYRICMRQEMFIIPKNISDETAFFVVFHAFILNCALSAYALCGDEVFRLSVTSVERKTSISSALHLHFFIVQNVFECDTMPSDEK